MDKLVLNAKIIKLDGDICDNEYEAILVNTESTQVILRLGQGDYQRNNAHEIFTEIVNKINN